MRFCACLDAYRRARDAPRHPDRFTQKFGGRLAPSEREAVLARVNEVAAAVNALRRDFAPKAAA